MRPEERRVHAAYYGDVLQACDELLAGMRGDERRGDGSTDEEFEDARAEFQARLLEAVLRSRPL